MKSAGQQMLRWQDQGLAPVRLWVNPSGREVGRPDLVETIMHFLLKTGFPPQQLELELSKNTIKIDQRLAPHVTSSPNDAAIMRGSMTIARILVLNVIAEGVENMDQLAFSQESGCFHIRDQFSVTLFPPRKSKPCCAME